MYSQSLPEQLSFMHIPKPFKNPYYTKNQTRRTQTLKTLLAREKERDKAVRVERKEQKMQTLAEKQAKGTEGDDMEIDEGPIEQTKKGKDGKEEKELDKDDSDWECDAEDLPSCKETVRLLL
jgi:INO80 complex subunit C